MPSPSLEQLRARVAALEGAPREGAALSLGVAEMDGLLPWGGVPVGAVHELAATGEDDGSLLGFAAMWLGRLAETQGKPVLWVSGRDDLYAVGLASLGLPAERLVMVQAGRAALWAMEEGLHCAGLAAVLGEVWSLDSAAARRLQLAARTSGVTALVINRGPSSTSSSTTALTRWRIGPAPSEAPPGEGVGLWRWRVELTRCRGRGVQEDGAVGHWLVEWNDETGGLRLAAVSGDRSFGPWKKRARG